MVQQGGRGDEPVVAGDLAFQRFRDRFHFGPVGGHHGGDELPPVTVDDRLVEQGVGCQQPFDDRWGDVLARRGDEQVLLAIGDREVPVLVDCPDVTGVKPPVDDDLGGRLGILPVPGHHVRPTSQNFTILGNTHLDTGNRKSNGAVTAGFGVIESDHRRCFGQSVTFEDRQTGPVESVADMPGQRSATRAQLTDTWPEDVLEMRVAGWLVERLDGGPDLLVEPRHGGQPRRFDRIEIIKQRVDAPGQGNGDSGPGGQVVVGQSGIDVAVGQPTQQDVVRLKKGDRDHRFHVGEEVAVRQHHALGISGCATGVDQCRQGRRVDGRLPGRDVVFQVGPGAPMAQSLPREMAQPGCGQRDGVERDEKFEIGKFIKPRQDLVGLFLVADDGSASLTVPQLVLDLGDRERGVHGDIGGTGAENCQVGDRPLEPILREDPDTVTGFDSQSDQAGGSPVGLASDIVVGDVSVTAPRPISQRHLFAHPATHRAMEIAEVVDGTGHEASGG